MWIITTDFPRYTCFCSLQIQGTTCPRPSPPPSPHQPLPTTPWGSRTLLFWLIKPPLIRLLPRRPWANPNRCSVRIIFSCPTVRPENGAMSGIVVLPLKLVKLTCIEADLLRHAFWPSSSDHLDYEVVIRSGPLLVFRGITHWFCAQVLHIVSLLGSPQSTHLVVLCSPFLLLWIFYWTLWNQQVGSIRTWTF